MSETDLDETSEENSSCPEKHGKIRLLNITKNGNTRNEEIASRTGERDINEKVNIVKDQWAR